MSKGKVITITGIPGVGTKSFCKRYESLEGITTKVYSTGDLMYENAEKITGRSFPKENLLNLNKHLLNAVIDRSFDHIIDHLPEDKKRYDRIIIDTHAQFFANDILWNTNNWKRLQEIGADMYLTLIDKPSTIKAHQLETPLGRKENHDLRSILIWQDAEVNVTEGWAKNYDKPMYVLPVAQDPKTVEALLKSAFLIYYQMPMTEASKQEDDNISAFLERLLQVGKDIYGLPTPIIDPRNIDIEQDAGLSEAEKKAIERQTVHRDMDWYIAEATTLIAYYPRGSPLSKGVSDESTRGHESGKDAFVIYDAQHVSPFMGISKKTFRTGEDFLAFFPDYMRESVAFHKR